MAVATSIGARNADPHASAAAGTARYKQLLAAIEVAALLGGAGGTGGRRSRPIGMHKTSAARARSQTLHRAFDHFRRGHAQECDRWRRRRSTAVPRSTPPRVSRKAADIRWRAVQQLEKSGLHRPRRLEFHRRRFSPGSRYSGTISCAGSQRGCNGVKYQYKSSTGRVTHKQAAYTWQQVTSLRRGYFHGHSSPASPPLCVGSQLFLSFLIGICAAGMRHGPTVSIKAAHGAARAPVQHARQRRCRIPCTGQSEQRLLCDGRCHEKGVNKRLGMEPSARSACGDTRGW